MDHGRTGCLAQSSWLIEYLTNTLYSLNSKLPLFYKRGSFQFKDSMKQTDRRNHCSYDDKTKQPILTQLRKRQRSFYESVIHAFNQKWNTRRDDNF